ncbi:type II toxin-antitoxin system PemK/MazF family toxin [Limosilactobacillus reuteri]|uniref:type II toxin-antitoxin system PemK/MazF family toxin n=1 Tax=Limosilactobacillus reuteri TaxID=1598 RepID=UPI001E5B8604|nr:type II toxin-antitoxin system PemK/MazF family toxin [Limosilactobacillus reuteri]MCC4491859.1 type II toxin-antitoxin system PemK/MazF family toxin [Limosilactobacillus reuteri]
MSKVHYKQGDIIYLDFSPAVDTEMEGIHPAVIISNDRYNRNTNYLMVVPITSGGTCFNGYVNLNGYKNIYGRVNATQIHCYSQERARSLPMERLRLEDFDKVKRQIDRVINDFCI